MSYLRKIISFVQAHKEKLTDQIESIIYPSLIDSCSTLAEDLDELSDQIEKQNSRLIELKEKWEREAAGMLDMSNMNLCV